MTPEQRARLVARVTSLMDELSSVQSDIARGNAAAFSHPAYCAFNRAWSELRAAREAIARTATK